MTDTKQLRRRGQFEILRGTDVKLRISCTLVPQCSVINKTHRSSLFWLIRISG